MTILMQDIRYGIRMLLKTPGITCLAILALTIGIGANSTIFTMVNSILLSPMPFPNVERMVRICEIREGKDKNNIGISGPNYLDLKERSQSYESISLITVRRFNVTGHGEPERIASFLATAGIFHTIGSPMAYGRQFTEEEEEPGKDKVVVLSYGYWNNRYGGKKDILNQQIFLNDIPYTVIGILPSDLGFFDGQAKIWIPLSSDRVKKNRGARDCDAIGMRKEGVSLEQARAELDIISTSLAKEYPETNKNYRIFIEPIAERLIQMMTPTFIVLHGAVGFVLLLACSIVASLLLAKAGVRQKEITIRASLGATRMRVIRQMLMESIILSFLGGLSGLLLTLWGIDLLKILLPSELGPYVTRVGIDHVVLGFTFTVCIITSLLFGLAPALQMSKTNLTAVLNEGGRSSVGRTKSQRILRNLVVVEIAFSLVVLIAAGLMVNSFIRMQSIHPGFDSSNMLTFHLPLTGSKYTVSKKLTFYRNIMEGIENLPGVESVAAPSILPLTWGKSLSFEIQDQQASSEGNVQFGEIRHINPEYFQSMKIPLLKGRYFNSDDEDPDVNRIIINEFMARRYENIGDPIGKFIKIPDWDSKIYQIVGVVDNIKHFGLTSEDRPTMYVPFLHRPYSSLCFAIRTSGNPQRLSTSIRQQIWTIDPDMPIENVCTMDKLIADTMVMNRFNMILVSVLSVIALILSSLGIYGIMSYSVSQRGHEIGIRMAIGAQFGDVVSMVIWQGIKLILIGIAIGLVVAFAVTRFLSSILYGITPTDPSTYLFISLLLISISILACYLPARKATKVDPMVTLRCE